MKIDHSTIENILSEYSIIKEVVPYKGVIEYETKKITINPAFDMVETLAHEVLHHYYEITLGTGATEWLVREGARELIKEEGISELMNKYIDKARIMPTKNLFGFMGG